MSSIKLRAISQDGIIIVKALIKHPMETGLRLTRQTGDPIPAHHIVTLLVHHEDQLVLDTDWGPGISANPWLSFRFLGGKVGERVSLTWIDTVGHREVRETRIK